MIDERTSCLDWQSQAVCFPLMDDSPWDADRAGELASLAKAMCARCPVIDLCRERVDEVEGTISSAYLGCVYAGETPSERVYRRRKARKEKSVTDEVAEVPDVADVVEVPDVADVATECELQGEVLATAPVESAPLDLTLLDEEVVAEPVQDSIVERLERIEALLVGVVKAVGASRVPASLEEPPVERCCLCHRPFARFVADLAQGRPLHAAIGHCERCYRDYLDLQEAAAKCERLVAAA